MPYKDPEQRRAYARAYAQRPERKAKIAAYQRGYYQEHKERITVRRETKGRLWRETHREYLRQYQRAYESSPEGKARKKVSQTRWYGKHREQQQQYNAAYYQAHREDIKEQSANWRRNNPEHVKSMSSTYRSSAAGVLVQQINHRRRRARLKEATIEAIDFASIIKRDKSRCGICGKRVRPSDLVFDHIIPLARGGSHIANNVQVAHRRCNEQKGAGRLPSQIRLPIPGIDPADLGFGGEE